MFTNNEKVIKFQIEIETDTFRNTSKLTGKFEVAQSLYPAYNQLLKVDEILADVNFAISRLQGYKQVTITVREVEYLPNYYEAKSTDIVSYRFCTKGEETTYSRMNNLNRTFEHWPIAPNPKKTLAEKITACCEEGNNAFLTLLRSLKDAA
jgi:hypothetical protein